MKIYKIILLSVITTTVINCSDYLEEEVTTQYSEETIFGTSAGLETAITGLYAAMASPDYYGTAWHGLVNPISGRFNSNQTASIDATSLNCSPTNIWLPQLWGQMYQTVNVANNIIQNVENSSINFSNRNVILGQAYFIRGVVYFDLVRLFGSVPLRLEPTTAANINMPKSAKSVIYNQIISDLEKGKTMLPDTGEYLTDRPKKWAAYGYLAKVYMTLAGQDGGNPENWLKAKTELTSVINKYSLQSNYSSLFIEPVGSKVLENTNESIFELQYASAGAARNSDLIRFYTPQSSTILPSSIVTFGRIKPNKEVYDQHKAQYPNDPRISSTFIDLSYQKYNNNGTIGVQSIYPTTITGNNSFPFMKKWLDSSYRGTTTYRNAILFRYADVLLMMAEIENELNGPSNAYQYVNQVLLRARNSVSPAAAQPADWSGLSQEDFRKRIMEERQYELLSEGQDWFDTRRRGYQYFLNEVVYKHNNHTPNTVSTVDLVYPVSVKNMLLPIPSKELETNQSLSPADQNPGY
jgi:starch-binding outer membrane protein, SusD/RagB family